MVKLESRVALYIATTRTSGGSRSITSSPPERIQVGIVADFLVVKVYRRFVVNLSIHDIIRLWILLLVLGGCLGG